tara:strand:+ start:141 stop:275 length:135 start_codon:yes stop_codon:yes gene_type:complete
MPTIIWITIGIICVVIWSLMLWEAYNTPVTPDDYDIKDEDIKLD